MLFRDLQELNRSAIIVDSWVLTARGAPMLLEILAGMTAADLAARRRRMRAIAPAMQWRLGPDDASLDALQLAYFSAQQLGGEHGRSVLTGFDTNQKRPRSSQNALRVPHPSSAS